MDSSFHASDLPRLVTGHASGLYDPALHGASARPSRSVHLPRLSLPERLPFLHLPNITPRRFAAGAVAATVVILAVALSRPSPVTDSAPPTEAVEEAPPPAITSAEEPAAPETVIPVSESPPIAAQSQENLAGAGIFSYALTEDFRSGIIRDPGRIVMENRLGWHRLLTRVFAPVEAQEGQLPYEEALLGLFSRHDQVHLDLLRQEYGVAGYREAADRLIARFIQLDPDRSIELSLAERFVLFHIHRRLQEMPGAVLADEDASRMYALLAQGFAVPAPILDTRGEYVLRQAYYALGQPFNVNPSLPWAQVIGEVFASGEVDPLGRSYPTTRLLKQLALAEAIDLVLADADSPLVSQEFRLFLHTNAGRLAGASAILRQGGDATDYRLTLEEFSRQISLSRAYDWDTQSALGWAIFGTGNVYLSAQAETLAPILPEEWAAMPFLGGADRGRSF